MIFADKRDLYTSGLVQFFSLTWWVFYKICKIWVQDMGLINFFHWPGGSFTRYARYGYKIWVLLQDMHWYQGCARFAVFLQKYFEFHILWSLSSVDSFLSQSNFQFQLDFNLHFVIVLDTPSQWCRNIFLKIDF